jgi:hypothetical protein
MPKIGSHTLPIPGGVTIVIGIASVQNGNTVEGQQIANYFLCAGLA